MKLYTFPPSNNSVKVMAVLHHLNIDPEIEMIDLTKGESQSPDFKAINPNGKIPALKDGDFVVWESQAIMRYLAEKHDSDLIPSDLESRATMNQWMSWHLAHLGPAIGGVIWERVASRFFEGYEPDEHNLKKCLANLERFAPILDQHLADREFMVGNQLTLADFEIATSFIYIEMAQLPVTQYQHIMKWLKGVLEIPAFKKAIPPAPAKA